MDDVLGVLTYDEVALVMLALHGARMEELLQDWSDPELVAADRADGLDAVGGILGWWGSDTEVDNVTRDGQTVWQVRFVLHAQVEADGLLEIFTVLAGAGVAVEVTAFTGVADVIRCESANRVLVVERSTMVSETEADLLRQGQAQLARMRDIVAGMQARGGA